MQIKLGILGLVPITLMGLKSILGDSEDITILNICESFDDTVESFYLKPPDILIIDDSYFNRANFISFLKTLIDNFPGIKTLVYTENSNADYLLDLTNIGVNGLIHRKVTKGKLTEAIHQIYEGGIYFDNLLNFYLVKTKITNKIENETLIKLLTKREKEVLILISAGFKNKDIAKKLYISQGTVEVHKSNLVKKLSLKNTAELTIFAASQKFNNSSSKTKI